MQQCSNECCADMCAAEGREAVGKREGKIRKLATVSRGKEHLPVLTTSSCGLLPMASSSLSHTLDLISQCQPSRLHLGVLCWSPVNFPLEYEQQNFWKKMNSERMKSYWIPLIIILYRKSWRECSSSVKTMFLMYSKWGIDGFAFFICSFVWKCPQVALKLPS